MYPGAHSQTQPDKPALIMAGTGKTVTYAELDERSNRLAQWWYAAGLRTGDGVAMLLTASVLSPEKAVGDKDNSVVTGGTLAGPVCSA